MIDTKKSEKFTGPRPVLACRMSPALAASIKGKFRVTIPTPTDDTIRLIEVGARLFLREWVGAATGRADLVRVVSVDADTCEIERSYCWHGGKTDDDLAAFALAVIPDHFPAIGY